MIRMTFRENEQGCEQTFLNAGQWWHMYTPGKETPLIFTSDADYRFAINFLPRCSIEFRSIHIVAFEIMSNHIHMPVMEIIPGDDLRDISANAKGCSLNLSSPISSLLEILGLSGTQLYISTAKDIQYVACKNNDLTAKFPQ